MSSVVWIKLAVAKYCHYQKCLLLVIIPDNVGYTAYCDNVDYTAYCDNVGYIAHCDNVGCTLLV